VAQRHLLPLGPGREALPRRDGLHRSRALIAILGDTHLPRGTRRLPDACVELLRRADTIVHTGDLTGRAALDELRLLGSLHVVRGNADEPALKELLPASLVVEAEGLRLGVVHSGGRRDGRHRRLRARFPDCDVIAYGHSHEPELTRSEGVWIVNPGSPTDRRRAPAHTIAVVEGGTPRLVEL
jgi:putative phosphoesterase